MFRLLRQKFDDVSAGTCRRYATVPYRSVNSNDRTEHSIAVVATPLRGPCNIGN